MDQTLRHAPAHRIAGSLRQWADDHPVVARVVLLYVAVLGVVAALPSRPAAQRIDPAPALATPAPYMTCGIDRTFDTAAGRCTPVTAPPPPCVQSVRGCMATSDALPTPAPAPATVSGPQPAGQPPADPFAGIMGITRNN
jgi:hypothetical protein